MSTARAAPVVKFAGLLGILLFVVGCEADPTALVKGTAQFDGQPIEDGSISFFPVDGKSQTAGGNIKNGAYSVKVPQGVMKVAITWQKETGEKKKLYDTDDSPVMSKKAQALPDKYADREKTELQYEVKPGINAKDWILTK
jgi:hypothetical protein